MSLTALTFTLAAEDVWTMNDAVPATVTSSSAINSNVEWTNLTSLSIDSTSSINANEKGCASEGASYGYFPDTDPGNYNVCINAEPAGNGGGQGSDGGWIGSQGAGFGGAGGLGSDAGYSNGGVVYGSNTAPDLFGSAGGPAWADDPGSGDGGGLIRLDVDGTFTHNGALSVDGGSGGAATNASGGGSGGSIYITASEISNGAGSDGTFSADGGPGGDGSGDDGGGGGGGRISVSAVDSFDNLGTLTAAGVATGGTATGTAAAGSNGTLYTLFYTAPDQPTLSPSDSARNMALTSSAYSSNGASHTSTDWYVCTDGACDANSLVWYSEDDASNLESITVNTTNGTFSGDLAGKTKLAPATNHQIKVRHTNAAGDSTWSVFTGQNTIANNVPSTPTNSSPTDAATDQSKTPTISASSYSDSDSDTHTYSTWNTYESSDCSGSEIWSSGSVAANESTTINEASGAFSDSHLGEADLKGHTQYSWQVRYDDEYDGQSSYSACTTFTTLNTTPVASAGSDQTVIEGTDATLTATSTDDDWNDTPTNTWIESLDSSDGCTLSGTTATTSNKETSYTCQFQVTADDGSSGEDTDTMTLTVTADNDAPALGSMETSVTIDEEDTLLATYTATDADTASLSFTASSLPTGSTLTDNSNNTATLTWTPDSTQSGTYTLTLQVSDGTTAVTQNITITVNDTVQDEEEEEPVNTIEDIGLVSGTESGPGIVTLYDNDNEELCSVRAWNEGGSVPFAVRFLDTTYVAVVKNKVGTTIHLYDLNCNIIEKKRLSPKLHPRNIVTRNFLGKTTSQEIGLTSRRGSTVYGKIFRYNPNKDKWYLLRQKTFRPVPTGYNLKKTKKGNILIKKNNKTLHKWEI